MDQFEMPRSWSNLLKTLLEGPSAWRTPGELSAALGRAEEETTDVLASLDAEGWLEVWEAEEGPRVTLSPLGAERLGVRLVELGEGEVLRWMPVGDPEPASPKARHVCTHQRAADLAFLVDPHPSPDQAAERADVPPPPEEARGVALPFPTLLIGQGLTPWPGPGRDPARKCPACGDAPLAGHAYCLLCERWGLDHLAAAARPTPRIEGRLPKVSRGRPGSTRDVPASAGNPRPVGGPVPVPSQADRARRKAKRRRRMFARMESQRAGDARRRADAGGKPSGSGGPPLA